MTDTPATGTAAEATLPEDLTYDDAAAELADLVAQLEQPGLDIETLSSHVRRATTLLQFCRARLAAVETDVTDALADMDAIS